MKRVLKWLLIVVGVLLALFVVAAVALVVLVDPNVYRDDISRLVEERTGRELVIEGDLELSFFPWLGIETGGVRLSDAPGFGEEPFLVVEQAGVAVKLMPLLLDREVQMDTLVLDGARIRLIRNDQGQANWEQLAEQLQGQEQPAEQPKSGGGDSPLGALALGGVRISDAAVLYEDRQAGVRYQVQPLNLTTEELRLGEPVPITADWSLTGTDLPQVDGELGTRLTVNQALTELLVGGLKLDLRLTGEQIPGGMLPVSLTAEPRVDLEAGAVSIPDLRVTAADLVLLADVAAEQLKQAPRVTAALQLPQFSPRQLLQRLEIPVDTADPEALQSAQLQAQLGWADSVLKVSDLQLQLDQTKASGAATLRSFDPVAADFRLKLDAIDVDRYLPPPSEEDQGAVGTPASAGAAAAEGLPLETLRNLNVDGRLEIGKLTVKGLDAEAVTVEVHGKNGVIRLQPINAQLYEGRYQGNMQLDARGEQPKVSLDEKLTGVQAGALLEDLIGTPRVVGTANLALTATTVGASVAQWIEQLSGRSEFRFTDGAVNGINLAHLLRTAAARLKGESVPAQAGPEQTDFSELAGTLTIDGGVLRNRDFQAKTPLARIEGEGKVNLAERTLNYLLTVNVVDTLKGQGGESLNELRNVPIPLRITGPLTEPKFSVDVEQAIKAKYGAEIKAKEQELKAKAEEKLQEEQEKVEKEVGEKLEKELGGKLQDLFKRKQE